MKILLSIKSQYVDKIASGEKRYEFRKVNFRRKDISSIIVYSSGRQKKIVGEIKFKKVLHDTPEKIWKLTQYEAGLSWESFMDYYKGKDKAYAIVIEEFIPYNNAISLDEKYPGKRAPQSFLYIDE
mgnify:FL=1